MVCLEFMYLIFLNLRIIGFGNIRIMSVLFISLLFEDLFVFWIIFLVVLREFLLFSFIVVLVLVVFLVGILRKIRIDLKFVLMSFVRVRRSLNLEKYNKCLL